MSALRPSGPLQIITNSTADEIAADILASRHPWAWVDGFSGVGKSTLAARVAHRLGWRHIELDSQLSDKQPDEQTYAERMNLERLHRQLGTTELRAHRCRRHLLARVHATH